MASTTTIHKRKRSLQDARIDLSKMRMALDSLSVLREELDGIQETDKEMDTITEHVGALERILRGAQKTKLSFSTMKKDDLAQLDVVRKRLVFHPDRLAALVQQLTPKATDEIDLLRDRLLEFERGSRMIIDAVLLTVAKIANANEQSKSHVAILPGLAIASGTVSGSHAVDYAVIQYRDELDNKERLLGLGGGRDDAFKISQSDFFLVEAKPRQSSDLSALVSSIPEVVAQAVALQQTTRRTEVRFCLSNGHTWIFFILKPKTVGWSYYESATRQLGREMLGNSSIGTGRALYEMVQLALEWLAPSAAELYELLD
ncbi:hypothetical protein BU15DRAFT_62986 [Melanogaster broomeanus]|nr:hypothetical protein BU15DRAFT_62986 [Melanogaster broomeanus]